MQTSGKSTNTNRGNHTMLTEVKAKQDKDNLIDRHITTLNRRWSDRVIPVFIDPKPSIFFIMSLMSVPIHGLHV